jgi:tRNA U54 and U55 pseudouridine synthase Pus10
MAKAVAEEVIEKIANGERVNMQEIQKDHGYAESSAVSMMAKRTKTYQETVKPLADALEEEINKIQQEMAGRDISEEKYKDLADVQASKIKNYQLLSDKPTDITKNQEVELLRLELKEWISKKETNV